MKPDPRSRCAPVCSSIRRAALLLALLAAAPLLPPRAAFAGEPPEKSVAPATGGTVLFVGNSFMFGAGSAVRFYRAQTVTDLNAGGVGGVPALFKAFSQQAGLNFAVHLETVPGVGLDHHLQQKAEVIVRPWDYVVMLGYSTLDRDKPGDPTVLVQSARQIAALLHARNPQVDIRLIATWSRADQVYPAAGHWHGRPIEAMARDVRAGYDRAVAGTPHLRGVIPVGEAWNRAFRTGVADPNPYDGIAPGQVDLWTYDHYHASTFGYYLEALMIFGDLTGLDPRSLGRNERTALELGLGPAQAAALQQVAFDELAAAGRHARLREFKPRPLDR